MARKSYRQKRRYRKGRWAVNIQEIVNNTVPVEPNTTFFGKGDICSNPLQSPAFVSQTYTVKNFELALEMESNNDNGATYIESLALYIMYVPQGMDVTVDYNLQHPEYIMAYRFYGSPSSDVSSLKTIGRNPLRIKTRLSRKLQTGDSIIYFLKGTCGNIPVASNTVLLNGLVRFWTKAN